jgi:hypothetical protein
MVGSLYDWPPASARASVALAAVSTRELAERPRNHCPK